MSETKKPIYKYAFFWIIIFLLGAVTVFLIWGSFQPKVDPDAPFTDDELYLMSLVDAGIQKQFEEMPDDYTEDETYNEMVSFAHWLEGRDLISHVYCDKGELLISFQYAGTGVQGGIMCKSWDDGMNGAVKELDELVPSNSVTAS